MRKNYGLLVLLSFGFVSLACPTRPIDGSVGGRAGSEEGDGSAGSGLGGKEGPGGTAGHSGGALVLLTVAAVP